MFPPKPESKNHLPDFLAGLPPVSKSETSKKGRCPPLFQVCGVCFVTLGKIQLG